LWKVLDELELVVEQKWMQEGLEEWMRKGSQLLWP